MCVRVEQVEIEERKNWVNAIEWKRNAKGPRDEERKGIDWSSRLLWSYDHDV